jgi:alpha-amylase/alpha-mannosidase (GH57 family)
MTKICLYLQAPVKEFGEVSRSLTDYRAIFQTERFLLNKPKQLYLQANQLLLEWLRDYPEFYLNLSLPASLLEQIIEHKGTSGHFRQLARHPKVETLARVHSYPQAGSYSPEEFSRQVEKYLTLLSRSLGVRSRVFTSKCLQFSNQTAKELADLNLEGVVNSDSDITNHWRHPDFVYQSKYEPIKILIQNQPLSDNLSNLLQNNQVDEVENFLEQVQDSGEVVNLFIDYQDLLQGADFFEEFLELAELNPDLEFANCKRVIREQEAVGHLEVPSVRVQGVGKRIISSALSLFNFLS